MTEEKKKVGNKDISSPEEENAWKDLEKRLHAETLPSEEDDLDASIERWNADGGRGGD